MVRAELSPFASAARPRLSHSHLDSHPTLTEVYIRDVLESSNTTTSGFKRSLSPVGSDAMGLTGKTGRGKRRGDAFKWLMVPHTEKFPTPPVEGAMAMIAPAILRPTAPADTNARGMGGIGKIKD